MKIKKNCFYKTQDNVYFYVSDVTEYYVYYKKLTISYGTLYTMDNSRYISSFTLETAKNAPLVYFENMNLEKEITESEYLDICQECYSTLTYFHGLRLTENV